MCEYIPEFHKSIHAKHNEVYVLYEAEAKAFLVMACNIYLALIISMLKHEMWFLQTLFTGSLTQKNATTLALLFRNIHIALHHTSKSY